MNNEHVRHFHASTQVLDTGTATVVAEGVPERHVPAVRVRNLYGQVIVWGEFAIVRKKNGNFQKWGGVANDANTEGVVFTPDSQHLRGYLA